MAALFVERENEILKTIRAFADAGLDFVVVGGYAVSGLGRHRFSVDLDVVIDSLKSVFTIRRDVIEEIERTRRTLEKIQEAI